MSTFHSHIAVSIVIPARNEEDFLPACLSAIDAQETDAQLEIIVVDNGSTDKTVLIAEGHGVQVLYEPVPGVGRARAHGTRAAHGTYVLHIDADTRLPKTYIQEALTRFAADPSLVCLGGRMRWYDAGKMYNAVCWSFHMVFAPLVRFLTRGALGPIGNNMMFLKSIYDKTTGFDTNVNFGEDADIAKKLHTYGKVRLDLSLVCDTSSRRFRTFKDITRHIVNTTYLCLNKAIPYNYLSPSMWRKAKETSSIDK
ncbi:MAG: hypothetical protein CO030_04375 [Candidatus Magasanikbacteria bacterium CG_4_9_14_0_2_um_filter_42_11]|uniref:Glycosyltransferase 2-like domain-containing protein n=1 Tax=Candidatus Magasanikbacteria bacterium CG_4_9_14_0_2_um_filter_42_11 TaxID=1974643 RepID=A0A2M8F8V4_9BACT|nr:MAG: hypothetical protein COU34_01150 [Candidatus Magasanikbacteria bacterium CG10_big_fil_rev_8_21_14_0_10_43_9]PIY92261.1 MAG: hypothetical protein COY70_04235 [Candidatus Magasanikbacteria bacterium CG_4_10_14_0_8_um_filter_42_12]PJC52160.1 MAG: hypothetical protein CO030_04375 [Candidatus Magasanikbacteria bacterium CG_4_9_14_0_2_um_filter_42_11]